MSLKDQLFIAGVWTNSDVRGTNNTGAALTSASLNNTGEQISGTYNLLISARAGSTGTVTISTASSNNPYNGRVVAGVTFDSATESKQVIPGVTLVFATGGANGNTSTVIVGDPYGAFDASGVEAGTPTTGVRHRVVNDGASTVSDAKVRLLTQAVHIRKTGQVFSFVSPIADGAVEKIAGGGSSRVMPYAMTISAVSGSGETKVATLSVDGVALPADSIMDISTGDLVSGVGLKALDPPYFYQIVDGDLLGVKFALSSACANTNSANILIFPSRYVQIAPDVAGVEGTYGVSDVDLTEAGQSVGDITPSGVAYYWRRFLVPASANSESNPYPSNVVLQASESQDAGWDE